MDMALTIPLLRALEAGGILLVGGWAMTGGYGTLPAVINPHWDDKPVWVGSRHIVTFAAKCGLINRVGGGERVSTWKISREGSALLRDFKVTRKYLRAKDDLPDNRDDDPEASAEGNAESGAEAQMIARPLAVVSSKPPAAEMLATLFRANPGVPFRTAALCQMLESDYGVIVSQGRVRGAVRELRDAGLWIESDMAFGFRYLGERPTRADRAQHEGV